MVTNHTEAMTPVWPPQLAYQWPESHWHGPLYYSPGSWQYLGSSLAGNPSFDHAQCPSNIPVLPRHWKRSSTPEAAAELHELLDSERQHTAVWDIAEPPLTARCITSRGPAEPIPTSILEQPATRPAVRDMRIVCESFPWDIRIHIPHSAIVKAVTVGIVLEAIHGVMQETLDPEEWERKSPTLMKKIYTEMCVRLCKEGPSIHANVRALKIDCLLGKTEFMGLKRVGQGEDEEWSLLLGPLAD